MFEVEVLKRPDLKYYEVILINSIHFGAPLKRESARFQ